MAEGNNDKMSEAELQVGDDSSEFYTRSADEKTSAWTLQEQEKESYAGLPRGKMPTWSTVGDEEDERRTSSDSLPKKKVSTWSSISDGEERDGIYSLPKKQVSSWSTMGDEEGNSSFGGLTMNNSRSQADIESQSISSSITADNRAANISHPPFWTSWSLYIASTIASVLALLALYGLLKGFHNRETPRWPYTFTLNSVVAILTIFLKIFMMMAVSQCIGQLKWTWFERAKPLNHLEIFDSASRGELLGSARLAWIQRFGSIATIGAVVVIFGMIIDPFTQQAVQYQPCTSTNHSVVASVPISKAFVPTHLDGTYPGDEGLVSAFYQGLLSRGRLTPPGRVCPSGKCKYEPYQTLSFCSSCRNDAAISHKTMDYRPGLTRFYEYNWNDGTTDWCRPTILQLNISSPHALEGTYSLPLQDEGFNRNAMKVSPWFWKGLKEFSQNHTEPFTTGMRNHYPPYFISTITGITQNTSCTFDWMNGELRTATDCINPARYIKSVNSSIDTSKPTGFCSTSNPVLDFTEPVDVWPNVTSSTCALYVCAKQYQGHVEDAGPLEEQVIDTSPVLSFAKWKKGKMTVDEYIFIPSPCLVDGELVPVDDFVFDHRIAGAYPDFGPVREAAANHSERALRLLDACSFRMSGAIGTDLRTGFAHMMWGQGIVDIIANLPPHAISAFGRLNSSFIPWANAARVGLYWDSTYYLQAFFNKGWATHETIADVHSEMAHAMEIYMRESDSANSHAPGTVIGGGTCIGVDFRWLIFPTIVVVTNVLFLVLTIIASRSNPNGAGMWGNQQLPLLFSGLSLGLKREYTASELPASELKKMEKFGEKARARLIRDADGEWMFSKPT